jgi:hypothetical protein
MPRRTRTARTRLRESEEVENLTFAEQMEYWHIPCTVNSRGRRTWRVTSG